MASGPQASQRIRFEAGGTGVAAVGNRGLGNEGLLIEAGQAYEGYFFARAERRVLLVAQLIDWATNRTLATQTIPFPGGVGDGWARVNFTLTASAGTRCVDGSSVPSVRCGHEYPCPGCPWTPASHTCVACGGQFQVGLAAPGTVNLDYVFLQPGPAQRVAGLPVLRSGVELLQRMGVTAIRLGGGFVETFGAPDPASTWDASSYLWTRWIGPPWARPSVGAEWGASYIGGWGPFEFVDMCNAAGIVPVFDTAAVCEECTPAALADLVEFCWGGIGTRWGRVRAVNCSHPEPYNVTTFELGNEQVDPLLPQQIAAMEARAAALGMAKTLRYINPSGANKGDGWLDPAAAAAVERLGLGANVAQDIHVHTGGGVAEAGQLFRSFPNLTFGAVNAETNSYAHDMGRALSEASDLNEWMGCSAPWCTRLAFRAASFCTERSGHYDSCDQGLAFFLPNMTWLQPPGHVHAMIAGTWAEHAVSVRLSWTGASPTCPPRSFGMGHGAPTCPFTASAQRSADGKTLFVRVTASTAAQIALAVGGLRRPRGLVNITTLNASDLAATNTAAAPAAVSPTASTVSLAASAPVPVPANSFTIFAIPLLSPPGRATA